jgi:DNA-binding NarL/FixJ family response regulator
VEITEEKTVREEQKTQKEPEDDTEKDAGIEKKIVSMYDRGFSEIDIAKKLGVTVGEVRLILQLFKRNVG